MHVAWWKRVFTWFPGTSCRGLLQHSRKIQSPINRRSGGNRTTRKLVERFIRGEVWLALDDTQRALLRSQHGPLASAPFTALPPSRVTRIAQPFTPYVQTLALAPSSVSSYLPMWPAACAEAGVLGRRGFPLECAAAQVFREAGARVATNVFVRGHGPGSLQRFGQSEVGSGGGRS